MSSLFRCMLVLFTSLGFASAPLAQISNVTNDQATPIPGVGHDYIKLLSETVSPANGSVSIRMQTPTPRGRLLSIPFGFAYDTSGIHHLTVDPNGLPVWSDDSQTIFLRGGWSYLAPLLLFTMGDKVVNGAGYQSNCRYYSAFVFQSPQGDRHALGIASAQPYAPGSCLYPAIAVSNAGDDFYRASTSPNWGTPNAQVADADGTVYTFGCATCGSIDGYGLISSKIEDRNGNIITSTTNSQGGYTFTDTLGRTLISSSSFASSSTGDTIGVSGVANPYSVAWKTVTSNFTIPVQPFQGGCPVPTNTDQRTVISTIKLPNGQAYTFLYGTDDPNNSNPYGLLSEIIYPSGSWVKYAYGMNANSDEFYTVITTGSGQNLCYFLFGTPVVTQRTVSFDGVKVALQQTFVYGTNWPSGSPPWSTKTTTVTTHDFVTGQLSETDYIYSSYSVANPPNIVGGGGNQVPVEQTITYKDGGNVLRTVNKTWFDQYELKSQQVVLNNNYISETDYTYGPGAQVTEQDDYDFGSGARGNLIIKIIRNYQTFNSTPIYPNTATIFDRPCQAITYDSSGTNRVSETDYYYDGSTGATPCPTATSQSVSGSGNYTGHDETNYGSSTPAQRGNLTKVIKQCFQGSQTCASANPTTTSTFDETGQVTSSTDSNNHTTSYSYADSYTTLSNGQNVSYTVPCNPPNPNPCTTNAYLTKITDALAHTRNLSYDFENGQLTASTDQNSQTTSYIYNDPFARPTEVDLPPDPNNGNQHGKTTYSYNDSGPSPSVTTSKLMNTSSQYLTSVTTTDGMAHPVKTLLSSDPDCTTGDRTDVTYDGLGRVHTVSNPYCSTTDTTYGLTTYTYDALSRTCVVAPPTGTPQSSCPSGAIAGDDITVYAGRATAVFDEGNGTQSVERISQSDALGRLTSVCEVAPGPFVGSGGTSSSSLIGSSGTPGPCADASGKSLDIGGTGFTTTYLYDFLNNLTQVNQSGIAARTFNYDSLSRLLSAYNPESGSITYTYDANGNLLTKTAPAPNQTGSATVTTCYGNWTGTSCDGTGYDALNRVTKKSYSDGTTPTVTFSYDTPNSSCPSCYLNRVGRLGQSSVPGWSFNYGYDAMGRLTDKDLWMASPSGVNYLDYTYDLLGDIMSETAGYSSVSYIYNTAARLTSVTSSYSDPNNPPNLISAMHYNAFGGLTSDTLGSGETETYAYVPKLTRLQSYSAVLNTTTTYSFNVTSFAPNGNVLAATDTANGNWNYSYDQFNRLVCADLASNGTCTTPPTGTPTYTYVYDRFGNRWQQNGPHAFIASFTGNSSTNNNRMDGYSYDAAGNLMNDGTHQYTYDAENRIISVDNGNTATYAYDPDGHRVEKISMVGNGGDPPGTWQFLYDQSGRMVRRFEGAFWKGETYAEARHLATLGAGTEFSHADWLGTERVRTGLANGAWKVCESIASLPFGDGQTTTGVCYQSSPLHFTGKFRDSDSGLDYFGARFDASSMGRFLSPDWSDKLEAVPYADREDPQSLNLYAYVKNNPLNTTDPDGHCTIDGEQHGWLWCVLHWAHFTETKKEEAAWEAENARARAAFEAFRRREIAAGRPDPMLMYALLGAYAGAQAAVGPLIEPEPGPGGIGPVLKGQAGVEQAVEEVEAEGGQVLGREITIETSAGRARADFVYRDAQGNLIVGEAKNGPTAQLNSNQQAVYAEFQKSGGRFVGGNAQEAKLPPSVGPTQVRIFKY